VLKSHALWALFRLSAASDELLVLGTQATERLVRVHALRAIGETPKWSEMLHAAALTGLKDEDPFVRRAAADALGQHPHAGDVRGMLSLWHDTPESDVHLRHTLKMAIRNSLAPADNVNQISDASLTAADRDLLADVCLGLSSESAGTFLL